LNEYAILVHLLTKAGEPIGASVEDMLEVLGLPEIGRSVLFNKLAGLQKVLTPLGLVIKHNPISHVFYLDGVSSSDTFFDDSLLPDKLAATLLVVITLAYQEGGWVSFSRIKEFRKKSMKGIRDDLKELSRAGYVEIDQARSQTRPGLRASFEIDFERFFSNLAGDTHSESS
jgi:hypothetical protein